MSIRSALSAPARLGRRTVRARRRTLLAIATSVLTGVLVVFGLGSPAQADGTYTTSNGVGWVQGSVTSGSDWVFLSGEVRDTNCGDSSSPVLSFSVRSTGGTELTSWSINSPVSCGSLGSAGTPIYAEALQGNRSGYVVMFLCQKFWYGTNCTGSFASSFFSIP